MGFQVPLWPLKVAFVFSFAGVGSEQWFMGFFLGSCVLLGYNLSCLDDFSGSFGVFFGIISHSGRWCFFLMGLWVTIRHTWMTSAALVDLFVSLLWDLGFNSCHSRVTSAVWVTFFCWSFKSCL